MNITLKIIRTIDSARNERATPIKYNILDAYKHALKNKIGLLYLESLDKAGMLPNELKPELELQNEKLRKSLITVKRVAAVLNKARVNYVVYKSLMPFPATLNDVDMLVLDPNEGFRRASTALLRNSFDLIAQAPLETLFHDRREQKHGDPEGKDVYDVDLYNEIGASYIISIDKRKLATKRRKPQFSAKKLIRLRQKPISWSRWFMPYIPNNSIPCNTTMPPYITSIAWTTMPCTTL